MKKENIIKKHNDFQTIIQTTKPHKSNYFILFIKKTDLDNYRFGIAVSKKIGNAVTRNKIKRQIKNILNINKELFRKGYDCIIIVNKSILNLNYNEKCEKLINILCKSDLYSEER